MSFPFSLLLLQWLAVEVVGAGRNAWLSCWQELQTWLSSLGSLVFIHIKCTAFLSVLTRICTLLLVCLGFVCFFVLLSILSWGLFPVLFFQLVWAVQWFVGAGSGGGIIQQQRLILELCICKGKLHRKRKGYSPDPLSHLPVWGLHYAMLALTWKDSRDLTLCYDAQI